MFFHRRLVNRQNKVDGSPEKTSGEKHHQPPVSTVFIVGVDDVMDFVRFNSDYKVCIEPDALIAAAKAVLKEGE